MSVCHILLRICESIRTSEISGTAEMLLSLGIQILNGETRGKIRGIIPQ